MGQIVSLHRPGRMIRGELTGRFAPAAADGRTRSQTFQAIPVIRAEAAVGILRMPGNKNMPHFRMGQAVNQLSSDNRTGSDACSDSNI
ncbi:hypothetical protein D3C81_1229110 [compost metagenome]